MNNREESVYVAATPYHILISAGLAISQGKSDSKYLFIISDFKDAPKFCAAIKKWKSNPFSEVILLPGRHGKGVVEKVFLIRKNIHSLEVFLRKRINGSFSAFLFSIEQPEAQFVAHFNRKAGGTNFYVEDGVGAYLEDYRKESSFSKSIKTMIYGPWYEGATSHIASQYAEKLMLLRPDLLKSRIGKEKLKIPSSIFADLKNSGFVGAVLSEYGIKDLPDWDALVLAPYSPIAKKVGFEKVVSVYRKVISSLNGLGYKVVVKYHPREPEEDFLGMKSSGSVQLIPQSISSELVCLGGVSSARKLIIGDATTGVFDSNLIIPNSKSFCIVRILGMPISKSMEELFTNAGTAIPGTVEELISSIRYKIH